MKKYVFTRFQNYLIVKTAVILIVFVLIACQPFQVVEIPDANLEAAIRDELDKPYGVIRVGDMESITILWADSMEISNLSGLEYCVNLEDLSVYNNTITDLSYISDLNKIMYLDVEENGMTIDFSTPNTNGSIIQTLINNGATVDYTDGNAVTP